MMRSAQNVDAFNGMSPHPVAGREPANVCCRLEPENNNKSSGLSTTDATVAGHKNSISKLDLSRTLT